MATIFTSAVATRLNRELKLKPRIRATEIEKYAERCGAVRSSIHNSYSGGRPPYQWTEENYQILKNTIDL
jgi:hypothetical protein